MSERAKQDAVTIEFVPNGPALVKGQFEVKEKGGWVKKVGPIALCRCGHSKSKPYCDGSHKAAGFNAE